MLLASLRSLRKGNRFVEGKWELLIQAIKKKINQEILIHRETGDSGAHKTATC